MGTKGFELFVHRIDKFFVVVVNRFVEQAICWFVRMVGSMIGWCFTSTVSLFWNNKSSIFSICLSVCCAAFRWMVHNIRFVGDSVYRSSMFSIRLLWHNKAFIGEGLSMMVRFMRHNVGMVGSGLGIGKFSARLAWHNKQFVVPSSIACAGLFLILAGIFRIIRSIRRKIRRFRTGINSFFC